MTRRTALTALTAPLMALAGLGQTRPRSSVELDRLIRSVRRTLPPVRAELICAPPRDVSLGRMGWNAFDPDEVEVIHR